MLFGFSHLHAITVNIYVFLFVTAPYADRMYWTFKIMYAYVYINFQMDSKLPGYVSPNVYRTLGASCKVELELAKVCVGVRNAFAC